jgi:hypothetical protein
LDQFAGYCFHLTFGEFSPVAERLAAEAADQKQPGPLFAAARSASGPVFAP